MALYEDLKVDQGADAKFKISMYDENGSTRDLTNYTARGKLNRSHGADSSEAVSFLVNIDVPPTSGSITFSLSNAQTELLTRRRYVYDIEVEFIEDSATIVERVLEGKLLVSPSVTK